MDYWTAVVVVDYVKLTSKESKMVVINVSDLGISIIV